MKTSSFNVARVGIDVGETLANRTTSFSKLKVREVGRNIKPMPHARHIVGKIIRLIGSGNVYIISKCQPSSEIKIIAWLQWHQFFADAKLSSDNIRFCRKRHEKASIAGRLGLTHFIDDRVECLEGMRGRYHVPFKYLFDPTGKEPPLSTESQGTITLTRSWHDIWIRFYHSIDSTRTPD